MPQSNPGLWDAIPLGLGGCWYGGQGRDGLLSNCFASYAAVTICIPMATASMVISGLPNRDFGFEVTGRMPVPLC